MSNKSTLYVQPTETDARQFGQAHLDPAFAVKQAPPAKRAGAKFEALGFVTILAGLGLVCAHEGLGAAVTVAGLIVFLVGRFK
jgi:hypothetical protein